MNRILFRGFSLIELLVVVVLLVLAGTMAVPAFGVFIERSRATAVADQLQAHLNFARASGVSLHRDIEVCGSSNGVDCDHAWGKGWIIQSSVSDGPLRLNRLGEREHLRWSGFRQSIRFKNNGTAPMGNGRFYICNDQSEVVWQLVINRQGRVRRVAGLEPSQTSSEGLCPAV